MFDDLLPYARIAATLVAIFSLFCRLNAMDASTPRRIAWQHEQLACALVMSLVLPRLVAEVLLVTGIALYLVMGAPRWRHGPPYQRDKGRPSP